MRRVQRFLSVLASVLLASASNAQELRWRSGDVLSRPRGVARASQAELLRRLGDIGPRHALVRFERAPSAHERALLAASGIVLGRALGAGAYFARIEPRSVRDVAEP